MRAFRKVTSAKLLTKQAMRKKLLYCIYKKIHAFELLCNMGTVRIEEVAILGNKFCVPVLEKPATCELSHILTPFIKLSLLKCCNHNQFFR
jgi:hypothetical protein